jgi:uncharacterized membrane protein YqjE
MDKQEENPKKIKKGILNPKMVRVVSFTIITLSLIACTVLCILAIWDFAKSDVIWRAIATFVVVSVTAGLFALVNERLG